MEHTQSETIRFLLDPATYGGAVPEHIQTHGAHVFLAGQDALKIKRAVKYDYMDLSTLDRRERMLRKELALNSPVTPGIYRDVVPITREPDGLALNGTGPPVEWVLRMHRFPKENELLQVAARGDLDVAMAEELGRSVAAFHAAASLRDADGAGLIRAILNELDDAFASMHAELGTDRPAAFHDASRATLERLAPLLTARSAAGRVRRCHGDLHLRNLVLIDGKPVPYDALEFDELLGTCDVLYDLAFLIMDLQHRGLALAANLTLNTWLFAMDGLEDEGVAALPLFLSVRAAIRAMVEVQTDRASGDSGRLRDEASAYLDEALAALAPSTPRLVAVGGVSGTGKTALARQLAPHLGAAPGAIHLRSDLERKRLAGADPLEHLPQDAYAAESRRAIYDVLMRRARLLGGAGHSVLVDATWLAQDDRAALETLARDAGVAFTGLWLMAPEAALYARVAERRKDASDADAAVLARQLRQDPGAIDWRQIDASGTAADTLSRALAALAPDLT